jgi:hypothetical protein
LHGKPLVFETGFRLALICFLGASHPCNTSLLHWVLGVRFGRGASGFTGKVN